MQGFGDQFRANGGVYAEASSSAILTVDTRQMAAHPGLGFGLFLTARIPRSLVTPTTNVDDGFNAPAA